MSNLLNGGGRRLGSIFLPLILIGLGALLLLQNAGLIQVSIWDVVGRLWPLIPVLIGIELLIGQRSPRAAVVVMLLVVICAVPAIMLFGLVAADSSRSGGWSVNITSDHSPSEFASLLPRIEEQLADVERAEVQLRFGVGELRLASLPASSPLLVAGDLTAGSGREAPTWEVGRIGNGEHAEIEITSGSGTFDFNSEDNAERWDLQLSPEIPIELEVQAGASQIELDLTKLRVPALQVEVGAAQLHLRLPAQGHTAATVEAGAADITIEIPAATPARIRTRGGLAQIEVDTQAFPRTDDSDVYQSPGYDASPDNRIDLEIRTGLAKVEVRAVPLAGQARQPESGG
ncbi:MAG: toast rack family protein [Chloroflexota bacterium]|nr:toast rack family protein [Chloroflexota bacterium]